MRLREVQDRNPQLVARLVDVWEDSVRATHAFLTDAEVRRIRGYVPQAIAGVRSLVVAEDDAGAPVAFMGADGGRLEMLFLAPGVRGRGLGRQLVELGVRDYGVREVTVNEQNAQAVGFYLHLGFQTCRRTERDEEGGPYPLLYMRLLG